MCYYYPILIYRACCEYSDNRIVKDISAVPIMVEFLVITVRIM